MPLKIFSSVCNRDIEKILPTKSEKIKPTSAHQQLSGEFPCSHTLELLTRHKQSIRQTFNRELCFGCVSVEDDMALGSLLKSNWWLVRSGNPWGLTLQLIMTGTFFKDVNNATPKLTDHKLGGTCYVERQNCHSEGSQPAEPTQLQDQQSKMQVLHWEWNDLVHQDWQRSIWLCNSVKT